MKTLILLTLILYPFAVMSANQNYYAIPKGGSFKLVEKGEGMPYFKFSGSQVINAEYKVTCERNCPDVVLYPSIDSIKNVPHLMRRGKIVKANKIWIKNDEEAALKLIGKNNITKLKGSPKIQFMGEANIEIKDFVGTYECDKASYGATFSTIKKMSQTPNSMPFKREHNC